MHTKLKSQIRLIRWMIRRVRLLEIRKHTCRVSVIEISYTYRCIYKQISCFIKQKQNMNFEDYKKIKDIAKRYSFLKELAIRHPEKTSKEFFLAVFRKERYLDMRLTAIRGYAVFATEKEIEPLMKKMTELLRKRPQTTPYNYQEYEILRSAYLMPYLLEKYGYTCFKDFNQQLNLQYDDMPDLFKGIFTCDENGNVIQLLSQQESEERWKAIHDEILSKSK